MKYLDLTDNLQLLLRMVPMASPEQVIRFFEDEYGRFEVSKVIEKCKSVRMIIEVNQYNTYPVLMNHRPVSIRKKDVERILYAFWIIASLGSRNVEMVTSGDGPIQYVLLSKSGEGEDAETFPYDITLCEKESDARDGYLVRESRQWKAAEDEFEHIALVRNKTDLESMKRVLCRYGYTLGCYLDSRKEAVFVPLEEEESGEKDDES